MDPSRNQIPLSPLHALIKRGKYGHRHLAASAAVYGIIITISASMHDKLQYEQEHK